MHRTLYLFAVLVALSLLSSAPVAASTTYNTTESYTENYIGIDLGGGSYAYYYAGHDVTSSGYPSTPTTYTETYTYTLNGESDLGIQVTPQGLIYYGATDSSPGPTPYDFTSNGLITGGTGIYAGASGSYVTQFNVFSGAYNGVDPLPTIPDGATIIDFGHDTGVSTSTFTVAAVPLPPTFDLLASTIVGIGIVGSRGRIRKILRMKKRANGLSLCSAWV